jgi:predicted metal-dependent hydrolase
VLPIVFVRNRQARRYILRVIRGQPRVTIPRGGSVQHAIEFARKNTSWLLRQLERCSPDWKDGTEILYRGTPTVIRARRTERGLAVSFGPMEFVMPAATDLRAAIESRLRIIATEELARRTLELAAAQSLEVRAVSVRNQRSRWGSCSARRTISLNWRLIQTPEFVRDYIIIHELMHLREMNHSAQFWAHVASACPTYLDAERWLRKNSRLLR